jgi:hypothetical protein
MVNQKKVDKSVFIYILCLLFGLINKAFLVAANIIGYALYVKEKKKNGPYSVRSFAGFCILLNVLFILVCIVMMSDDRSLIKTWGYKFDKEIVLYCFNNPNSEALFLFLCLMSVWLFLKNKPLRIITVIILTYFNYRLTYGRTFFFASIGLIVADMMIKKRNVNFFSWILVLIPIVVFLLSLGIGLVTMNYTITFYDEGMLGRFLMYGRLLRMMTPFNFIFGISEELDFPLDGSFFALFVTMGFFMFMYLLVQYIKYIKKLDIRYSSFIAAIFGLILSGVTESALALFSINSVLLITLLVSLRRVDFERHNNYCSRI